MFKNFLQKILNFYKRHEYFRVFSLIWVVGFLIFGFQAIRNGFALPINGDYSLQQLHFYVEGHDAFWTFFKTGEFKMWSYEGFLGTNYFAANTFYYLTSPFSLPIYFLPRILIPQGIFVMMTIKIATGGLFMYILFKKFYHTKDNTALIGAIAYALCGWGMFYVWFNHFHDVLAVLPLTLIGVECCIQKRKGYVLAIALFVCGLVNYFFLFTFVFSTAVYALFRYFQCFKKNKGHNLNIILQGLGYSILGVGMCAFVILPALNVVSTLSRVDDSNNLITLLSFFFKEPLKDETGYHLGALKSFSEFKDGENIKALFRFIFVWPQNGEKYVFFPLTEFVFPEVGCWENILFKAKYYDNTYCSLYISMPLMLLTWVRLIQVFRSKKVSHILAAIFLIVVPFVPFCYILFGGFSAVMYGRWLIVIVIFILCATVPMLDNLKASPLDYDFALLITLVIQSVCIGTAASQGLFTEDYAHVFGVIGIMIYTFVAYYILKYPLSQETVYLGRKFGDVRSNKVLLAFVVIDLILTGAVSLRIQGVQNYWSMYGGQNLLNEQRRMIDDIQEEDPSFYRIFDSAASRNANNLALTLGYKGLGSFHSVNNYELETFIQSWTKASYGFGSWSMGIDEKRYNLDTFLSVKYYLLPTEDTNVPFGFTPYKTSEHYTLYRNDNWLELGYSFDNAIPISKFTAVEHFMKEAALNSVAVVNDEDVELLQEKMGDNLTFINKISNDFMFSSIPNNSLSFKLRGEDEQYQNIKMVSNIGELIPEDREEKTLYGRWKAAGLSGDTLKLVFPENRILCEDATPENPYHLIVKLCYGPNVEIRLYHNDTLITKDAHGPNNYDHSGDHKYARGFYVDQSITSIEFEILNDTTLDIFNKYGLSFYREPYSAFKARQDALKEYPLENVKHTNNTVDFTTNYPTKRLIVLSVPYDKGWSLTVNGEEADIIKVDSGFIGMIANEGEQTYHLQYRTPNLSKGVKISAVSFAGFGVLTFAVVFVSKKKKNKEDKPEEE